MIYKSNLTAPDLTQYFRLLSKPRPWSFGHDIPSHPDIEPECCYFSHDEAAIMYNVAVQIGGWWVDIGSRFGWSTAHLMAAACSVYSVDPIHQVLEYSQIEDRAMHSLDMHLSGHFIRQVVPLTSVEFLSRPQEYARYDGFVIDGNHDSPEPLHDATLALMRAKLDCAILFHDFYGRPIRDAVRFLMAAGWKCRIYWTPNGVALCWRGFEQTNVQRGRENFMPPFHEPDPAIRPAKENTMPDFDFRACV
jgi:Methyltransferase domain